MDHHHNATGRLSKLYKYLFSDIADRRSHDLFLMSNPGPLLTIIFAYLYFVLKYGPEYMKHRKAFELKYTLVIYNFLQVVLSIWMFFEFVTQAYLKNYSIRCQPVDYSLSPLAIRVYRVIYIYFLAKVSELLDTVFFVLRKKNNQVSFLHLYHHTCMPLISWSAAKYVAGGHGAFIGLVNSFVHIVMYFYYMVAAMGPQYHRYLWWKKYITTIQMVQFGLTFIHNSQLFFIDCGYPRWVALITVPNTVIFYFLFSDFYKKSYQTNRVLKQLKQDKLANGNTKVAQNGTVNGIKLKKNTVEAEDIKED